MRQREIGTTYSFMDEPTEIKSQGKRSGGFAHWVYWFVVMVLLYVLSFGPVMGLAMRVEGTHSKASRAAEIFYTPVLWLCDRPLLEQPFNSYIEWWVQLLAKKDPDISGVFSDSP
ncbi:MAG: hypothetical protein JWQ71_3320 [Pedosphaera sp.]|nr:hypothetical protein [Pedosphaera sp.]